MDQHARKCVSAKRDEGLATEVSEVSSHRASRVEQAHARDRKPQGRRHEDRVRGDEAEAVSGVVKTPGPLVMPRDDHGSSRASRVAKVTRENRERTARGCTSIRSDGRSRLDASRVFRTGRSQDLVAREGASQEEARSTA